MTVHEEPFQLKDFIPRGIFQRLNNMSGLGWLGEKLEDYLDYSNLFSLKMVEKWTRFLWGKGKIFLFHFLLI